MASDFLTGEPSDGTLEGVRSWNGDTVRYNDNTGEFGIVSSSGTIKTYSVPDPAVHGFPTNIDYFDAQF